MSVIVVGVDFTPCSASGLRQAIRIAGWRRATVQAVHAIEPLVVMDLEQALSPRQTDIRAGLAVEIDHPVPALLRNVREQSAELLVADRGHAGPSRRSLRASTSRRPPVARWRRRCAVR